MTASSHVPHSELIEALLAQQSHPQNPSHKDEITVQLLILSYIHEMVFAWFSKATETHWKVEMQIDSSSEKALKK